MPNTAFRKECCTFIPMFIAAFHNGIVQIRIEATLIRIGTTLIRNGVTLIRIGTTVIRNGAIPFRIGAAQFRKAITI